MIKGTTTVVGVWGWPVKHSASPAMHNAAYEKMGLDWVYVPFSVNPENIPEAVAAVRALGIQGINVTVPLKELVVPHLDFLTPRAQAIGAVNTLFWQDGKLGGDSTDGPGFLAALSHAGVVVDETTHAVVLGAGGSARAVVYALAERGASVTICNRTPEKSHALQERFHGLSRKISIEAFTEDALTSVLARAHILVNTTSIGMSPHPEEIPPVPIDALHPHLFVSDLIYNPAETKLLATARAMGCLTQNGVEMLVRQGAIALERWTAQTAPIDEMREAVLGYLHRD
jgi:shikimate dehydrogenase